MSYKRCLSYAFSPSHKSSPASVRIHGFLKFAGALAVLFAASFCANAHPYASGITNNGGTIKFILNETADDVKVVFDNGTATNDLGALSAGVRSFSLSTHTNYSIIVTRAALAAVTLISVDSTNNDIFGPRGVAVNRNPKSHNFGRVYVANANAGASGNTVRGNTTRGIFALNADVTDALGYGAIGHGTNGIALGSSTTYAPYRVYVAPDDSVYFSDASGGPGGGTIGGGAVWMLDADLNNPAAVFKYGLGGTTNFGPCISKPVVSGSTNGGNLVLYCSLWGYTNAFTGTNYTSIFKYNIGSGPLPWNTIPTNLAPVGSTANQAVNGSLEDLEIAPDGKIFVTQERGSGTGGNVNLWVYDTDGQTILFNSSVAGGGTDPFATCHATAVSPDDNYVASIRADGNFLLAKLTNGIPDLSTLKTNSTTLSSTARGVAFDAADNIYLTTGGADRVRVYSIGLAATTITANDGTTSNGTFQLLLPDTNLPSITLQPTNRSVLAGFPASFTVTATGTGSLSYQWQYNSSNLTDNVQFSGSQTNTLSITGAQTNNVGAYRVIVTNNYGATTSMVANLAVTVPVDASAPGWYQFPNSPGPSNSRHDDIYFTDPTNGWATLNNNIYRTTNGGATWTTNLTLVGTHFRSIGFATPLIGFAGNLGKGSYDGGTTDTNVLYRTTNGGVTWSNVPGFAEAGMQGLCSICVLDSQHIYGGGRVRGTNAWVIKSTNGGFSWSMVNLSTQGVMNGIMDIYFKDPTNGWVVGMDTNSFYTDTYHGRIAKTTDGGNTWTTVVTTPAAFSYFWKMSWPSTNIGYVSLQQNASSFDNIIFYKTVDGGLTWASNGIPMSSVGLTTSAFYLQGIGFVSTNEGWIGGASASAGINDFLHTVDGGQTWTSAGFNDTHAINRIRFLSPTLGFASGGNTYIYTAPITITTQPQSQAALYGTNVNLNVVASSYLAPNLSYQWLKDGASRAGATNSSFSLGNITRLDTGTYSVIITNSLANVQSSNAVVHVLVPERLDTPVLLPGGQFRITFADSDGGYLLTTNDLATFEVQVSTNFVNWSPLTNALSITNGAVLLQDDWTNSPMRYYRIREHWP